MKPRLKYFLLVLLLLMAAPTPAAHAHANLLQSTPEANARLDRAPVLVELFFSEPIEAGFSAIQVLDTSGKRVDNDDATVDPGNPIRLTVTLRSLPAGIYTVSWRTLSSVGSHVTTGAFPFAVGNVDNAALAAAQTDDQLDFAPGAGDGPVGLSLNPPPADLTQHTVPGVHPDGRLYNWISSGVEGSIMPAFDKTLSDEERWHIVNYIRTLSKSAR